MIKYFFSFNGKVNRLEYLIALIIHLIIWILLSELIENYPNNPFVSIITLFVTLINIRFLIAQGVKRCHDIGKNGWFQFIPFYFIYLLLASSKS